MSAYDKALFLWHDATGNLMDILAMHVDNFLFCGNDFFQKNVIAELKKILKVGTHKSGTFWGLQSKDGITIDQNQYVSFISPIDIKKESSLRKNGWTEPRREDRTKKTGQVMWVSTQTQTDVAFDVCWMSNTGKFPKLKLLFEANKALQKLKSRTRCITFSQLEKLSDFNIVCYANATYASLEDGSSQGGFIIFVCSMINRMVPICWSSKKLDQVTKSTLASETLALCEAAVPEY